MLCCGILSPKGKKSYRVYCAFIIPFYDLMKVLLLSLFVDVWLYMDDTRPAYQTVRLQPGVAVNLNKTLAVACIPKSTPFYEGMAVDILKWLADGSNYGASSRF